MKTREGNAMLVFHPAFGIRHNYDGRDVSCTYGLHFTPNEISWYTCLLGAEWIPGLLNADRRNWSLENFTLPSVLWRNASTDCATFRLPLKI